MSDTQAPIVSNTQDLVKHTMAKENERRRLAMETTALSYIKNIADYQLSIKTYETKIADYRKLLAELKYEELTPEAIFGTKA